MMGITLDELVAALESFLGHTLNDGQRRAIGHGVGPLWIIAGPGTGKTEVLVNRCLKLLCVDTASPLSIFMTTFTEKAATNLQDRLYDYLARLKERYSPRLDSVDLADLHIGTLHGLCNEIMQTHRHLAYQNVRLLDEIEQSLFMRDTRARALRDRAAMWSQLRYLVADRDPATGLAPNLWQVTKAAKVLFNRIVEDRVDVHRMRDAGGAWLEMAEEYADYVRALREQHRCDFAHLQHHFLEFLGSERGAMFLSGDANTQHPGIAHVLVDEYQDTNPVQEEIYLQLADAPPHNLTVVGDDDQALYRFRGSTVECMVEFAQRCQTRWPGVRIEEVTLTDNYRSHATIVRWCNQYISSFSSMQHPGARAPGKQELVSCAHVAGAYPAVGWLSANRVCDLPGRFVSMVQGLIQNGIVPDYSQCALLLLSTQETPRYAGPYVTALRDAEIPVYNPRSKAYVERQEIAGAMGAFLAIVDPDQAVARNIQIPGVLRRVQLWDQEYHRIATGHHELARYVQLSQEQITRLGANEEIRPAMPTILYRILAFEPFVAWQQDQDRDGRLSKLTRLFEAYCSLVGRPIRTDNNVAGRVSQSWLNKFYYLLMGYLDTTGVDDDEIDEEICPAGRLPVMTIHQSKGLQFPFVFVAGLGIGPTVGNVHQLEDELLRFRAAPPSYHFAAADRAEHDMIRMFYVAYSRAQYALILVGTRSQLLSANRPAIGGQGLGWFNQRVHRL